MLVPFEYLWIPALFVTVGGAFVLIKFVKLSRWSALTIGLIKAAVPFVYFAQYYDGSWNFIDDKVYFEQSRLMLWEGNNPFLIFFTPDGLNRLVATAGSYHMLYHWWNLLAMYVFSPFYSSPIFLNVFTTFVSAALLFKIVCSAGFNDRYARLMAIFLLFHWDVLTWSSLVNLKDVLIMMLTLVSIFCGLRFIQTRKLTYLAVLVATMFIFVWIRFYLTVLILGSFGLWLALSYKGWKKVAWVLVAALCIWLVFPEGTIQTFQDLYVPDWLFGPVRMVLTPQPWSLTSAYSFLLIPSTLHWALFIPASMVGLRLAMKNQTYRLVAIYFIVMIVFYGLIPEEQGPRQRLQVSWIMAWAQFDVLWAFAAATMRRMSASKRMVTQTQSGQLINQKV